jgi:sugar lactone lactonase YvrE
MLSQHEEGALREFVAEPCTTDLYYLGESCRWDEVRGELYWVDLDAGRFFRATADATRVDIIATYEVAGTLSAMAPMRDRREGWIVATNQSIAILDTNGQLRVLDAPEEVRASRVRMNDAAADPWGAFWFGSMAYDAEPGSGNLFRYAETTGTETVLRGLTVSNGLGWSPDRRVMYFADSGPSVVYAFDVDDDGGVASQRTLIQLDHESEGDPDGLCVDAEGALWVAVWGGSEVRRYSAAGEWIARVSLPTSQPASCAIGGTNGTTLYVTTAREDMSLEQLERESEAGRIFGVDVGVPGLALNAFGAQ